MLMARRRSLPAEGRRTTGQFSTPRRRSGLTPKYAYAYYTRAVIYRLKGDNDRAILEATEVIRLNPKYAVAYDQRAVAYRLNGDYEQAILDATEAIHLHPKCPTHAVSNAPQPLLPEGRRRPGNSRSHGGHPN